LLNKITSFPQGERLRGRFYPFYVSDDAFRLPGYIAIGGIAVLLVVLWFIVRSAMNTYKDPASHPTSQLVTKWGEPHGVAVRAQAEYSSPRLKGGKGWIFTEHYLIRNSFFSFQILRIEDLIWAYQKVTKHYLNFIPTGKTFQAIFHFNGGTAEIQGNKKKVEGMMAHMAQCTPWAVFGFSEDLKKYFKAEAQSFCAEVEQRRKEWNQKA
jgi:hypothetical protein